MFKVSFAIGIPLNKYYFAFTLSFKSVFLLYQGIIRSNDAGGITVSQEHAKPSPSLMNTIIHKMFTEFFSLY